MKILQVPFHFYPDAVGGTEVYVSSLAKRLAETGTEVEIAAPGDKEAHYFHDGLSVHRFKAAERLSDVSELYGEGDPDALRQFISILNRTAPDVVHLHALSPAVSLRVVREIKRLGLPVIFTYHIPGITCPRGTLLRYGVDVCDGLWNLRKCSRCVLHSHGVPKPLCQILGSLPPGAGKAIRALPLDGRAATALRTTELQASRQRMLTSFLAEVDQIVAVSEWVKQLLVRNGIADWRIKVCRHGVTQSVEKAGARATRCRASKELRIAFIGRLYPIKGAHVLVEAIRRRPNLPLKLDLYGIVQERHSELYVERLKAQASNDPRIRFLPPIPNEQVVDQLSKYDLLAIPSQWMETGPLVVYDAFSAGIPVVGSDRGGIAELIEHGKNGLLVEPSDVTAWADVFERLSNECGLIDSLSAGITPPRTMVSVAAEMLELYDEQLQRRYSLACADA